MEVMERYGGAVTKLPLKEFLVSSFAELIHGDVMVLTECGLPAVLDQEDPKRQYPLHYILGLLVYDEDLMRIISEKIEKQGGGKFSVEQLTTYFDYLDSLLVFRIPENDRKYSVLSVPWWKKVGERVQDGYSLHHDAAMLGDYLVALKESGIELVSAPAPEEASQVEIDCDLFRKILLHKYGVRMDVSPLESEKCLLTYQGILRLADED